MAEKNTKKTVRVHPPKRSGSEDNARAKLLDTGIELFGLLGFKGATTRMIAAQAGVNSAAIPYYFGSKDGLYHAVIQFIADTAESLITPLLESANALMARKRPKASEEELLAIMEAFIRQFITLLTTHSILSRFTLLIIREQLYPSPAFERLFNGGPGKIHEMLYRLSARLLNVPENSTEAIVRAHIIFGQVIGFRAGRMIILHRLNQTMFTPEQTELIITEIVRSCRRVFQSEKKHRGDRKP